ncbi:MAG: tetratricopeptide repeat protein [candidate division KSB1 bacterium]|nr:tetratricopeptide repeat protein [candidate division KSB1 bacterium]
MSILTGEERLAFYEQRWLDLKELIKKRIKGRGFTPAEDVRRALLELAERRLKEYPRARTGVVYTLFTRGNQGVCLPMEIRFGKPPEMIDMQFDYELSLRQAVRAVERLLNVPLLETMPSWYLAPPYPQLALDYNSQICFCFCEESASLSAAINLISHYFREPIPGHIACSAMLTSDGCLHPIENLPAKLESVKRNAPWIRQIIISAEQTDVGDDELITKCQNLESVIRSIFGDDFFEACIVPVQKDVEVMLVQYQFHARLKNYRSTGGLLDELIDRLDQTESPSQRSRYAYALAQKGLHSINDAEVLRAGRYFKQAERILQELENHADASVPLFEVYSGKGVWYTKMYQYAQAEKEFDKAFQWLKEHRWPEYKKISVYKHFAMLNIRKGQPREAQTLLNKALSIAQQAGDLNMIPRIYCLMAVNDLYNANGQKTEYFLNAAKEHTVPNGASQYFYNQFWLFVNYYWKKQYDDFVTLLKGVLDSPWLYEPFTYPLDTLTLYALSAAVLIRHQESLDRSMERIVEKSISASQTLQDDIVKLVFVRVDAELLEDGKKPIFYTANEIKKLIGRLVEQHQIQYFRRAK